MSGLMDEVDKRRMSLRWWLVSCEQYEDFVFIILENSCLQLLCTAKHCDNTLNMCNIIRMLVEREHKVAKYKNIKKA
jgi:hypothetical protein